MRTRAKRIRSSREFSCDWSEEAILSFYLLSQLHDSHLPACSRKVGRDTQVKLRPEYHRHRENYNVGSQSYKNMDMISSRISQKEAVSVPKSANFVPTRRAHDLKIMTGCTHC